MIDILQNGYKSPTKMWVWAVALREWAGLIIGGVVLLIVLLFLLFAFITPKSKVYYMTDSKQKVALPMDEIVKFMALIQKSMGKRQEVQQSLMETLSLYPSPSSNREEAERKVQTVSNHLAICNSVRSMMISDFSKTQNPFSNPGVKDIFTKLTRDKKDVFRENDQVIDPQIELNQWGALCELCESEVKKANAELVRILNSK
jgi:hypothetical protein